MKHDAFNSSCVQKKACSRRVVAFFLILATFASGQDSPLTVEDWLERISGNTEETSAHTYRTAVETHAATVEIDANTAAMNRQLDKVNQSLTNYMFGANGTISYVRGVMSEQEALESAYDASTNADLTASLPVIEIPSFSGTDETPPEMVVASPSGVFNSTLRVVSADDFRSIWRDLGVSWTGGHLELDFSIGSAGDLIQRSGAMLSVVWKLAASLAELWIVVVWWRRIRALVLHEVGMPDVGPGTLIEGSNGL